MLYVCTTDDIIVRIFFLELEAFILALGTGAGSTSHPTRLPCLLARYAVPSLFCKSEARVPQKYLVLHPEPGGLLRVARHQSLSSSSTNPS